MPRKNRDTIGLVSGATFGKFVRAITGNTMALARKTNRSAANYRGLNIRRKK